MIDTQRLRDLAYARCGKDDEVVVAGTRRWLKQVIFEIEAGRKAASPAIVDYDLRGPPPQQRGD